MPRQAVLTLVSALLMSGCASVADIRRSEIVFEHASRQSRVDALTCVARAFDEMSAFKVDWREDELVIHYGTLPGYIIVASAAGSGTRLSARVNGEITTPATAAERLRTWIGHC